MTSAILFSASSIFSGLRRNHLSGKFHSAKDWEIEDSAQLHGVGVSLQFLSILRSRTSFTSSFSGSHPRTKTLKKNSWFHHANAMADPLLLKGHVKRGTSSGAVCVFNSVVCYLLLLSLPSSFLVLFLWRLTSVVKPNAATNCVSVSAFVWC